MGRGGYNYPTSQKPSSFTDTDFSMQGRGGYNDVNDSTNDEAKFTPSHSN
jgi:hypothetical protein